MGNERTPWRVPRAVPLALAIVVASLVFGLSAPEVRAATPTLTILSPADGARIGNGTPVVVIFVVSEFNLSEPGRGGGGGNEGHVRVFVDDAFVMVRSQPTVELSLPSGAHGIRLQLVLDNGTELGPEATDSVSVTVTQGPAFGTPQVEITHLATDYPTSGVVFDEDITISFRVTDFALVPPRPGPSVPNEGHIAVFLDDVYNRRVTTYEPVPFSDLADGEHTVVLRLVDSAGQALTPDAFDSVTFRIQRQAVVDINPYLSIAQIVLGFAILGVLFYRGKAPAFLRILVERVRRRTS